MFKVKGKIVAFSELVTGINAKGDQWRKQDFVLDLGGKFSDVLCLTCFNDKIDKISNLNVGDEVDVDFALTSRPYNGKYFHNVNAISVDLVVAGAPANMTAAGTDPAIYTQQGSGTDDLPF